MKVRPSRDLVLVKCEPFKDEIQNGVLILAHQQRVQQGEVLAVGPGYHNNKNSKIVPLDVEPGEMVVFFRENMETLHGKQLKRAMIELSQELGKDVALIPASSILMVYPPGTKVTA